MSKSKDASQRIKKSKLIHFINGQYDNVMVLAGAGSSISSDKNDTGLTMYRLAEDVNDKINNYDLDNSSNNKRLYNLYFMAKISNFYAIYKSDFESYRKEAESASNKNELNKQEHKVECFKNIYKESKTSNIKNIAEKLMFVFNNFEDLLSDVNAFKNFVNLSGVDRSIYRKSIIKIHQIIRDDCTITFNPDNFGHIKFIKRLQALSPNDKRLKIYSTNYDTLFDQAAAKCHLFIIDGFNYGIKRKFDSSALNIDFVNRHNDSKTMTTSNTNLCNNVIKIFQLHGSVSWYKYKNKNDVNNSNGVYKTDPNIAKNKINDNNDCESCMIFPSRNKYEQSYEDPFFDLFFNFQRDLHKDNTLLIVVGFSFGDMHIKRMVYDAMMSNKSLSMIFISHSGKATGNVADFFEKRSSKDSFGSRELLYKGDLSDFAGDLDLKAIYGNH